MIHDVSPSAFTTHTVIAIEAHVGGNLATLVERQRHKAARHTYWSAPVVVGTNITVGKRLAERELQSDFRQPYLILCHLAAVEIEAEQRVAAREIAVLRKVLYTPGPSTSRTTHSRLASS